MDSFSGCSDLARGVLPNERERALALVKKLPPSIRVGAYDFEIEQWHANKAAGARRWGECSCTEMRISIQQDMPCRVQTVHTLVHEINHAVWWAFGVEDEDKEERTVNLSANGWTCVYRDNPWLLDWLKEAVA